MSASPVSAVIALLTQRFPQPPAAVDDVRLYHSRVTDPSTPRRFVIVSGGTGTRSAEAFTGRWDSNRVGVRLTITVTLPAGNPGPRAEWLATEVERVLAGAQPVIDGKRCSALRHELTRFMGADEALADLASAYYVADFSLTVTP